MIMMMASGQSTSCMLWQLVTLTTIFEATYSQIVSVSMSPVSTVNGARTTLTCSYSVSGEGYVLARVVWYNSDVFNSPYSMARFTTTGGTNPEYFNGYNSSAHTMTTDDSMSTFTFAKVNVNKDERVYGCEVVYDKGLDTETGRTTATLTIIVLPIIITMSDSTGNYFSDNEVSYLVDGEDYQYTCQVPGIKPGASFTWTLGNDPVLPDNGSDVPDMNGLITSTSMATISATWIDHGKILQCAASNKADDPGVSINVRIDVKVQPKSSSMALLNSSGDSVGDSVDVIQGEDHTMTCRVVGTRPAATIRWFLNDTEQSVITPTPGGGNGLVDTEGDWTFTPERVNHRQVVKCEASIAGSETPSSLVSTTLNVIGPPDTPMISGSMTMTENVATSLTCTADLGYPEDWTLEWSNEGTAIGNSDTTSDPSGTSQRYMFTSQLEFTPNRQDNTHNIMCTVKSNSWTSTPLPEQTWGPINVQYETNITNKDKTYVGIRSGLTANLSCVAKGNPAPAITWFDPNITKIVDGGGDNKYMVEVSYTTSDSDMTSGHVTISKLTIQAVDPEVDYGMYTCNSSNGIGRPDSHEIIIDGTRRPNPPAGVVMTEQTSSSIAVRWKEGDDGGEPQWFIVGHRKSSESWEPSNEKNVGLVTTYNVTGLESYTQYEIRVYAENAVDRNPNPGSIVEYTLPLPPVPGEDFTIEFNAVEGKVKISRLTGKGGCIQLEVKYKSSPLEWKECGECIETDGEVNLAMCPPTRKRRRRAAVDVDVDVRARFCQETGGVELCSEPTIVKQETPINSGNTAIIVGGVVGGCVLLVIIGGLIVYLKRTSPNKPTGTEISSSIELATDNFGQNGQVNEGLRGSGGAETNAKPIERLTTDSGDTYAIVKKEKRPHPKAPPPNLPDVTYAEVNKKTPVAGLAKKPKKYVPPSKVTEESDYDDVKVPQQNKKSKSGAGSSGYEEVNLDSPKTPANYDDGEGDYANLTEPQSDSGRTVNEDGLIYMEVGHLKSHPVNQPPIQTEESTTYASIDFLKKTPDVARN